MQSIAKKFFRVRDFYEENAIVQDHMQNKLLAFLLQKKFHSILEIGCGVGSFTKKIINVLEFDSLICSDLEDYGNYLPSEASFLLLDANEIHKINQSFDLIISNACIQWLDQEKFFLNLEKISLKGTTLVLGSFGKDNLKEIKQHTSIGLSYFSLKEYQSLLQEKWQILYLEEEIFPINFKSPLQAFRHLKFTGVNSLDSNHKLTKKSLKIFEDKFKNTITYHPIYIIAKKL
ncbi:MULTISPECIES: methyltransferase domain-containing protein [unclassified Helicobacter]|uniref:methyltransferase domain-containing protein n=1 Tax=unclassified Helicobacter TaxID=2593540 RepID=UPI000CF10C46|nr:MULTISPECIES: methyltransferase domain-containing protein [unclassified Helicobacter]